MLYLKQSTASQSVVIGPFVDSTDGNTAETGLTIANTDIRLSKNGANIVAKNSGGGTHDEIGYYTITLDATDTDTVGRLQLMVHPTGALPVYHEYQVLEENVFDAIYGASAALGTDIAAILTDTGTTLQAELDGIQADTEDIQTRLPAALVSGRMDSSVGAMAANTLTATAIASGAITSAKFAAGAIDAAAIAADAIGASELAADAVAEIADAIWDEATTGHTTSGTFGEQVKTDIDAILVDTAEIGTAGAGLTEAGGDGDHLTAINLPNQTMDIVGNITGNLSGSVGSVTGAVGSVTGNVTGSIGSLAAQAKADVNAEVLDVLNTDTFAEPGQETPPATTTLVKKIGYLYKLMRNRITQSATELKIYNDDATTVDHKATVSDDGTTYDRGEIATGP